MPQIRRTLLALVTRQRTYSCSGQRIAKPFTELPGLLRQQLHDPIDELFRGIDRRTGAVERYVGIGPKSVIGDRLEIVGLGQELTQLKIEPGLVSRQSGKLPVHALVGFGVFTRALRDQRLRRVKGREVGIAAGVFAYPAARIMRARVKDRRALSKCSIASGVIDRCPRGEFPASARCDLHRSPPGGAWRE
jgi:hypothetical protein